MIITLHSVWDSDFVSRKINKKIAEIGYPILDAVGSTHVKVRYGVGHIASGSSHIADHILHMIF